MSGNKPEKANYKEYNSVYTDGTAVDMSKECYSRILSPRSSKISRIYLKFIVSCYCTVSKHIPCLSCCCWLVCCNITANRACTITKESKLTSVKYCIAITKYVICIPSMRQFLKYILVAKKDVVNDYLSGWTPSDYVADESTVIFEKTPSLVDNGDINAPYPGHTLTVVYSLSNCIFCDFICIVYIGACCFYKSPVSIIINNIPTDY